MYLKNELNPDCEDFVPAVGVLSFYRFFVTDTKFKANVLRLLKTKKFKPKEDIKMAKKVIYQVERHKVLMVEVQNEQEEQAVLMANRDFEKMEKRAQRERLRTCSFDKLVEEDGFDVPDDSPSVEEQVCENIEKEHLHRAIAMLTAEQQEIIKLVYFDGVEQQEVAKLLGISKGAISQRLQTIYKKLKEFYEKT